MNKIYNSELELKDLIIEAEINLAQAEIKTNFQNIVDKCWYFQVVKS